MESEAKRKPTLQHIRTLFPFDVATLAEAAGVETDVVYYALQQRPIAQFDAERILRATSQHTGLELSCINVEIVTWEAYEFLWLVRASRAQVLQVQEQPADQYALLYARNREHAAMLTHSWLQSLPEFPYHSFTRYGDGFQIENIVVPGHQRIIEIERQR